MRERVSIGLVAHTVSHEGAAGCVAAPRGIQPLGERVT